MTRLYLLHTLLWPSLGFIFRSLSCPLKRSMRNCLCVFFLSFFFSFTLTMHIWQPGSSAKGEERGMGPQLEGNINLKKGDRWRSMHPAKRKNLSQKSHTK